MNNTYSHSQFTWEFKYVHVFTISCHSQSADNQRTISGQSATLTRCVRAQLVPLNVRPGASPAAPRRTSPAAAHITQSALCRTVGDVCTSAQIKSDNRSRLLHETADRLVYCHEVLRMRTKMQKEVHLQYQAGAGRSLRGAPTRTRTCPTRRTTQCRRCGIARFALALSHYMHALTAAHSHCVLVCSISRYAHAASLGPR